MGTWLFYDLNVVGNRHISNNIRILLVNNGKGTEFRNYNHLAARFGDEADRFMAAAGHYGNKSHVLIRHYAEDLGYEYLQASTKEEYLDNIDRFLIPSITDKPILFEVFTNSEDESNALRLMNTLIDNLNSSLKQAIKKVVPKSVISIVRKYC